MSSYFKILNKKITFSSELKFYLILFIKNSNFNPHKDKASITES